MVCDFACCLPMKPSTLNLFNIVVHFDDASGFNSNIESVEIFNYYNTIPSGLIAADMDDTDSVVSYPDTAAVGDIGEST